MISKTCLRKQLREARSHIPADVRLLAQQSACTFLSQLLNDMSGICALYMPIHDEASPLDVSKNASHLSWALPVTQNGRMTFALYKLGDALHTSPLGILEPSLRNSATPDIIVTPLLGFNSQGARIGYGQGYYDRYFSSSKKSIICIGFGFSAQECTYIPTEPHDITLHYIVTEKGIISANRDIKL